MSVQVRLNLYLYPSQPCPYDLLFDLFCRPRLSHFHHLYCYLFVEFDKFWLSEKPANVMEFNRIRDLFENNVRASLADPEVCLRINLAVDTV